MSNQTKMQPDEREGLRQSFMRLGLPWRVGELAASLSSVRSWADHPDNQRTVLFFLGEAALFIQWLEPDSQPAWQADLAEVKQLVARWRASLPSIWDNAEQRATVAAQAGAWCDRFVQHSGLLDPEINPR